MASIERWVLVNEAGDELDPEYDNYQEAEQDAEARGYAVVERHYVFRDSKLVWTPGGQRTWPGPGGR